MNKSKVQIDDELQNILSNFLGQYGNPALRKALQLYEDTQNEYICKTRTSISKIKICDIYYMMIKEHHITIYTQHDTYHKYGTLNNELRSLSSYNFIKCAQNCIVSLKKIRTICNDNIILINNTKLHMSKKYAITLITAFSTRDNKFKS